MEKPNFNGYKNSNTTTRPTTFDGTEAAAASHAYKWRSSTTLSSLASSKLQLTRRILRATALVLTFIAAIVMGTGKDTARVLITDPATMKTSSFVQTTTAKHSSALVYFIVTNVLMFLYSAVSLAVSFLIKETPRPLALALTVSDLLFLILLYSSNGAAITTSIATERGNIQMGWIKICGAVRSFCSHVAAAVVLSVFASVAHLVVVMLEVISVHNRE